MMRNRANSETSVNAPQRTDSKARVVDFRLLFERSPLATFIVDAQYQIHFVNQAACELTGCAARELRALRLTEFCTLETDRDRDVPSRPQLLTRKDGGGVVVEVQPTPLGNALRALVVRDLGRDPPDYAKLTQLLEGFQNLVEVCSAAVVSADSNGLIRSWNPAAETLFGYTCQEAIGMSVDRLVPERLRDIHLFGFNRRARELPPLPYGQTLQTEGLTRDGQEVPLEVTIAISSEGGKAVFLSVIRDLREYRAVVDKLNDALQRLQFHIARMPLAYIVWDPGFHVVEWNPAATHIFGFTEREVIGRHAYDLIVPPDVVPKVDTIWGELLRGETPSHSINPNQRKDGSRITCEWFNTPLRDPEGRIRGVASMAQDITDRSILEARIRDAQRIESLGVLASGVAHDFNSSLMVILGNASLLRHMKDLPAAAERHVEMIMGAGAKAESLIQHMLAYARTGCHNSQPTNLNMVIRNSLGFVRSTLGRKCDLTLRLEDDLPPIVADVAQVEQVILNLCLNAKQAMADSGTVIITTKSSELSADEIARSVLHDVQPGRYVELIVADRGKGMTEEVISRIFDPFYTSKPDGHGLGLAAVLGILRQHEATVLVDSKPGQGTSMHVYFPAHSRTADSD